MSKYLTVSEYAKLKGISTTAVYKKLNGSLKPFQTVVNGKKCLLSTVLELDEKEISNQVSNQFETVSNPATTATEKAIQALIEQLQEKDKQIERLQAEMEELRTTGAEKDRFIQEQATKLSLLLEQSQELQRNNQILLGYSQAKPKEEEPEAIEPKREEPKKSIWKRIFRKS